ncbi:MAG: prolyl oligopeptidase family serine peptidase [Blastocatellia bacterium]|nr:prolyl oligopeptidase family serine peptidase [Blastocatellia bacterium]
MRRNAIHSLSLVVLLAVFAGAQTKPRLTPADYGQWENLAAASLSPDGKWLAYGIVRSNRNNELRIVSVAGGEPKVAAFGAQPVFSSDSRWAAYSIGYSEAQEEKLRKDKKPIHRKLGLLNLLSGEQTVMEGIESFAFSANGAYLAMRRYAPERAQAPPALAEPATDETAAPGATLIVRQLADGRDTTFGNVAEYVWQDLPQRGRLLAMTISAEAGAGNGVQLFDPETNVLRVLDSAGAVYSGLAWRKDSADLAALRAKSDDRREGATQIALAWKRLGEASEARQRYDPTADAKFPAGMRTVAFRRPTWSQDGNIVFVGIARWSQKPAAGEGAKETTRESAGDEDEPAGVDVWHARDVIVMPKQKIDARLERQRNLLAAWHVEAGRLVQLGRERDEQVTPLKRQPLGYVTNWSAYAMERSIGRPAADLSLIDLANGERAPIKERLANDFYVQASPNGRYLLFLQDDHYWTVNTATRAVVNITRGAPTSFVDRDSDATIRQKPAFGVAGWTKNDESVILYDKFDLWQFAPDGSRAKRLTDGAAEQVRHRYLRLNPEEEWIDPDKPAHLSLFGIWSKRSGFARMRLNGGASPERLVWLDKGVQRLAKARDADVYSYSIESFDDSPDVFVGDAALKDAKQVTRTNPFQSNYAWGRSELVEYKTERGERLQGALFYPANYEPGRKYPMVVYLYERLSDGLHRYSAPSEREYYNTAAFTQQGYFLFQPDIVFQPREPGRSVIACVTPAVNKVVEMGLVDARKVGVVGHSWGGFDASYLATHTEVFAAAVAGAAITNLVSNYGSHHFSSGIAETDHIETGQQRMEVPIYEDLPAYIRNSAVYNVHNMKTALLLETGDNDGTVFWHQAVELYNIARRAGKNVVMLVYGGEDHGLRKRPNQMDYHRRIHEWFGHYLKGDPAPAWITNGVSALEREQELKRRKSPKGAPIAP